MRRAQYVLALVILVLVVALFGAMVAGAEGLVSVLSKVVLVASVGLLVTLVPRLAGPRRPT